MNIDTTSSTQIRNSIADQQTSTKASTPKVSKSKRRVVHKTEFGGANQVSTEQAASDQAAHKARTLKDRIARAKEAAQKAKSTEIYRSDISYADRVYSLILNNIVQDIDDALSMAI